MAGVVMWWWYGDVVVVAGVLMCGGDWCGDVVVAW